MAKSDYMPNQDEGKASLFVLFRDNIGAQLATLGIPAADPDIVQQAADASRFRAIVDFCGNMQNAAQAWTLPEVTSEPITLTAGGKYALSFFVKEGGGGDWGQVAIRYEGDTTPAGQVVPALPAGFPAAVPAGIVTRFRALVKRVKAGKNYSTAIGQALAIEGSVQGAPDLTTLQAILTLTLSGNAVLVGWGWQGNSAFLDLLEIQVDRGDGKGWGFLTFDTTPNYTDTTPLPATLAKWKYRAIYRVGDAQVGAWSNEVSITVGG